jgi:hypothetical protein
MTAQNFEETFRKLARQKPFVPFIVDMKDGRRIVVEHRHVVINGNGAGFISKKNGLVDIRFDQIEHLAILTPETLV